MSAPKAPAMFQPLEVAREVLPGESDESLDAIIWNRTGWPVWFPRRFKNRSSALRFQLRAYKKAAEKLRPGESLCDFCNHKAVPGDTVCRHCRERLEA